MEYDLYHDESKMVGYWHGMLLVPRPSRPILLGHLAKVRSNTGYADPIELKGLKTLHGPRYRTIRAWIGIAVAALVQDFKGRPCHIYTGEDGRSLGTGELVRLVGARFILFRVKDGHAPMTGLPDDASRVETTFRMGFKGGVHLFSNLSRGQLVVKSFHFDGYEHYGRRVDPRRVVSRLGTLRDGVAVASDFTMEDESSDHRRKDCQSYDDCQLLQLTDLLVSGFRTVLGEATSDAQRQVSEPLRSLADKWGRGYARMKRSRWFGGFCMSECWLESGEWVFSDVLPASTQDSLF